jgi:hypothetical protein
MFFYNKLDEFHSLAHCFCVILVKFKKKYEAIIILTNDILVYIIYIIVYIIYIIVYIVNIHISVQILGKSC